MSAGETIKHAAIEAAAASAVLATLEGAAYIGSTGTVLHRARSHHALKVNAFLENAAYTLLEPFTDGSSWNFIHEIHHGFPDANIGAFAEREAYLRWREGLAYDPPGHPDVPDTFDNLDLCARGIKLDTMRKIGSSGLTVVEGYYEPYEYYPAEHARRLFDPGRRAHEYTCFGPDALPPVEPGGPTRIEDLSWRLRDPHSPVLHPRKMRGNFRDANNLYHVAENGISFDELKPEYLQRTEYQQWVYEHRGEIFKALLYGHLAAGAATGLLAKDKKLFHTVKNAVIGGNALLGGAHWLLAGSVIVNTIGHGGRDWKRAVLYGDLQPYPDGTYGNDAGIGLGTLTLDETNQGVHHRHPEKNAYTEKTGWRAIAEAPFGSGVDLLARNGLLGLSPGDNFAGFASRPDVTHEAVRMLERERVRTIAEAA